MRHAAVRWRTGRRHLRSEGLGARGLRAEFVALVRQLGANRRALCQRFGIRWLGRGLGIGVRQAEQQPLARSAEGVGDAGSAHQPGAAM